MNSSVKWSSRVVSVFNRIKNYWDNFDIETIKSIAMQENESMAEFIARVEMRMRRAENLSKLLTLCGIILGCVSPLIGFDLSFWVSMAIFMIGLQALTMYTVILDWRDMKLRSILGIVEFKIPRFYPYPFPLAADDKFLKLVKRLDLNSGNYIELCKILDRRRGIEVSMFRGFFLFILVSFIVSFI